MATVLFVLSGNVYNILALQIKCQKFNPESECQIQGGEERDLRYAHDNIRIHTDVFQNFSCYL